jgi:adenine-specific DNA-methyltransferase
MAKKASKKSDVTKTVEALKHREASRKNIPTAEHQAVMREEDKSPIRVAYERRNRDLDPQLVWRGKDEQDWSDLVVHAPPLYIQEKVHPKFLVDDLLRQTQAAKNAAARTDGIERQMDLFADFNGLPDDARSTEFYQHDAHWSNRMILGDSLQVMASLAEREGLRGQVQCIYIDPPYGIKFNSNFQWSTTSRDVKDGNVGHITREPEQVKAFRDTWRDGIHSYLTYLRDRFTVARDLLADSGSVFVQIGDENVHRVRAMMDEVFGEDNCVSTVVVLKTSGASMQQIDNVADFVLWYSKSYGQVKYRQPYQQKPEAGLSEYRQIRFSDGVIRNMTDEERANSKAIPPEARVCRRDQLTSQTDAKTTRYDAAFQGKSYPVGKRQWATPITGMRRLIQANRVAPMGTTLSYIRFLDDFVVAPVNNIWADSMMSSRSEQKIYVVQSSAKVVQRCMLMATDPGDLVLDPTCGSGTTAYVAEQWGRRWITIDTSRVALALARARIMGARYPYYLLADSKEGQQKEAEVTRSLPSAQSTHGNIRHGFVYERVPHITLKSIANNAEIDVIWEKWQEKLEPIRESLNKSLKKKWEEWEIPRDAESGWSTEAKKLHGQWWQARIARQKEIDASIAAKAEFEYLYDKPYEDKKVVRVAGPFTVESLSPHRVITVGADDELVDPIRSSKESAGDEQDFVKMVLENLLTAGVQQAHKEDKVAFTSVSPWPGYFVCAEGRYTEGEQGCEKRAAIFIGPEFGTVSRPDLVAAAREAGDAGFDVLVACAFNYDAHSSEFNKLGRLPVLKARMNADLHMADDLKNTGKGNLFVIFGEPDIDILDAPGKQIQVKINGVDVFHPNTGEVRSDGADGIACWFIDTDYNEESFFVRQAYFLGANDPYKALKTTLKAEINEEAWSSLNSDTSRPFDKPASGRIAVKVINHLGDEVMKVFRV